MKEREIGGLTSRAEDIVRRGALAGIVAFSPLVAERVSALEGLDGQDWQRGSALFMDQAKNGNGEAGGAYVELADGTKKWIHLGQVEGGADVYFGPQESINALHQARGSGNYTVICRAHSHSISAAQESGFISQGQESAMKSGQQPIVSIPPSGGDLEGFVPSGAIIARGLNLTEEIAYRQVVFTPEGAYYFEPATDKYLQKNFPEASRLKEEVKNMEYTVAGISATVAERNASIVDDRLKAHHPELRKQFFDALKTEVYPSPSSTDIVGVFLLSSGYNIPDSILEQLELSPEDETTVRRYRELLARATTDGIPSAQLAFVRISKERVPTSDDYQLLYAQYADAGWAIRYVSREDIQKEKPCTGIPGNE